MSYEDYQDMISKMSGADKKARAKARAEAGITTKDYRFDEKGNQWNGTLYFLKGEPVEIRFYIWKVEGYIIEESVSKDLGYPVYFTNFSGGNGHYSAEVKKKDE